MDTTWGQADGKARTSADRSLLLGSVELSSSELPLASPSVDSPSSGGGDCGDAVALGLRAGLESAMGASFGVVALPPSPSPDASDSSESLLEAAKGGGKKSSSDSGCPSLSSSSSLSSKPANAAVVPDATASEPSSLSLS